MIIAKMLWLFRAAAVAWTQARWPGHFATLSAIAANAAETILSTREPTGTAAVFASRATRDAAEVAFANFAPGAAASASRNAIIAADSLMSEAYDQVGVSLATDALVIQRGNTRPGRARLALDLADAPLWPDGLPDWFAKSWAQLRELLWTDNDAWEVWINWYEDRLAGNPSLGEAFDLAIATLPEELWKEGAATVNKRFQELINEYGRPEPISVQQRGVSASHVLGLKSLQHWFGTQPPEVALTLSCRAALRALPLLVDLWGRPNFRMLHFFRAAHASWTYARYPDAPRPARTVLGGLSENSRAGAAITLAEAAALPRPRNLTLELAARAIVSSINADEILAAPSLEELLSVQGAGDVSQRALFAANLADAPIWRSPAPRRISSAWVDLERQLLADREADWQFWIDWYLDRLQGRPSFGEPFDLALAALPNTLWEQGPAAVNAQIKELIAEHAAIEPVPEQSAGPHFDFGDTDKIVLARPFELDAAGNNIGRLRQLLPLVREAAEDLSGRLNANAFPELARNLMAYRGAIDGEPADIIWGIVFARGVRLDNAASATRRAIDDRLHPPLEDAAQESLDSMLALHGPMILSTSEGRELMEIAGHMLLTRDEQDAERARAAAIAIALGEDKDVIEPPAATVVLDAVEAMGQGLHPERGSAVGGATIRNAMIWTVGVAAIAAVAGVGLVQAGAAMVAIEGLKKSKRFSALTDALGARIDGVLRTGTAFQNFVIRNEQPLRQMAENSPGMRWMLPHIDDIVRRNASKK